MRGDALGFVRPDAACPDGICIKAATDKVAIAYCRDRVDPREKLGLCLSLHARARAFLPFPLKVAIATEAGLDRARNSSKPLDQALAVAQVTVEIHVFAEWAAPAEPKPHSAAGQWDPRDQDKPAIGRSWLSARCDADSARRAADADARRALTEAAECIGADVVALERTRSGLVATAVAPLSGLARFAAEARNPSRSETLADAIVVSGPWPLFSRCDAWRP
ncbi:MAG: hypothetical protein AAGG09_04285 [Pseudomonadota bacterium]